MLNSDHIEFYTDDELDKMLAGWVSYYDAVDNNKDQYVLYPRIPFSYEDLRRDKIRRDFIKADVEDYSSDGTSERERWDSLAKEHGIDLDE